MNNPILIIDPGHGERDNGCHHANVFEKDLTLKISLYQLERFKQLGINTTITRDKDIYLSPSERTRRVIDNGAKYCISNHINAGGGEGCEVIHSIYNNGKLANKIYSALIAVGLKGRRVFCKESIRYPQKDYYFMHRNTGSCTTNIVEYGFIDNEGDRQKILNNWQDYAESVVKAFCSHIDHLYIPPKKESNIEDVELKKAIDVLKRQGIVNNTDYWVNNAISGKQINGEYAGILIKRVSKLLDEGKIGEKPSNETEYYEDGKMYYIKTKPKNIKIDILGDKLHKKNANGINGTFFDVKDPASHEKVWGIAASDCKWVGNSAAATHAWRGYPQSVVSYYKDGTLGLEVIKNLSEMSKAVVWSIGGVGKEPAKEGFFGKYADVLRKTNHTMLGFDAKGYVYLVSIKNVTVKEIESYMKKLNAVEYIILDGGGSTQLNYNGKGIKSTRKINTAILVK